MSTSLATKGIMSVVKGMSVPDPGSMNGIITRGFIKDEIVTRGFGKSEAAAIKYYVVPVCAPNVTSHEYGELYMRAKELKPVMRTKTLS